MTDLNFLFKTVGDEISYGGVSSHVRKNKILKGCQSPSWVSRINREGELDPTFRFQRVVSRQRRWREVVS